MANNYVDLPAIGAGSWKHAVASATNLPVSGNTPGDVRVALDTQTLYEWNGTSWVAVATPGAAIALDGLIGDVSATGPGVAVATVNSVGGQTAASIAAATTLVNSGAYVLKSGDTMTGDLIVNANVITNSITTNIGELQLSSSAGAVDISEDLNIGGNANVTGNVAFANASTGLTWSTSVPSSSLSDDGGGNLTLNGGIAVNLRDSAGNFIHTDGNGNIFFDQSVAGNINFDQPGSGLTWNDGSNLTSDGNGLMTQNFDSGGSGGYQLTDLTYGSYFQMNAGGVTLVSGSGANVQIIGHNAVEFDTDAGDAFTMGNSTPGGTGIGITTAGPIIMAAANISPSTALGVDGSNNVVSIAAGIFGPSAAVNHTGTVQINNYPLHSYAISTGVSVVTIAGIVAGTDGQVIYIQNNTGSTLTFLHLSVNSTAQKIFCKGATSNTLPNGEVATLINDSTNSLWRMVSH